VTPSADGVNGTGSPLAKRKKVAAERTGYSKLKEAISADDLRAGAGSASAGKQRSVDEEEEEEEKSSPRSSPRTPASDDVMQEGGGNEDAEGDEDDEDDDDFLARELEEEWG
jgi:RNA polymerase II subunit A-like phosphatase